MSELTTAREIDRICRAFEQAWQIDGGDAQIEHWASQATDSIRLQVLSQLRELDHQLRTSQLQDVSTFDIDALMAEEFAVAESRGRRFSETAEPDDLRNVLLGCPTFAALSPDALGDLEDRLQPVEFAPQQGLIKTGQPASGLYLITRGEIEVIAETSTGPRVLERCGSGSVVGEMSLLTGGPCTATVVAMTPTAALQLSVDGYRTLCEKHPEIEIAISQLVSDRLGGRKIDALHGKLLGGYRVMECIGRGGMGVVYRARAVQTEATVQTEAAGDFALKMLRHRFIYDQDAVEHFQREGDLLTGIRHHHLVNIEASFLAFRTRFLVMERCDGHDLARFLAVRGPLPESQAMAVLGQLAAGLMHLHAHQILHLDLKPSNLMLCQDGTIKITDFGLCRLLDDQPATVIRGTPAYMAPEQLTGDDFDHTVDWYASACVIYELMTGKRCFPARDLMEVLLRKTTFDPDQAWPDWPASEALREVLAQALQPEPKRRVLNLKHIAAWAAPVEGW